MTALKGKITRSKTNMVARDYVKVPTELLKLHKDVFLTADKFFVDLIPFFLSLSRKICFTGQPPHVQNCSANIQGIQGDISVLSPARLPHHDGTCQR
jgi:hypothetical protein